MAVYIKENNSDSLQLSTSWVGGVAPGQLNTGKFDATLSAVSSITLTGRWMIGSFWYSNSCPVNSFSVSGSNVESYNNTGSTPNGRSILIEAGRTFTTAGNLIFLNAANHAVEVAAGSELIPNALILAALSGSGTSSVTKYGSGTMWFGRATSTPGVGAITGLTIAEGTIKVAGLGGTGTNPIGTGNITFNGSGTPTLQFSSHNSAARTLPNAVVMTTAGTIDTPAGFTATMSGAASGAGALTISGGGTLNWSNTISCPLTVTGTLAMSGTNSITGSTLSGAGTINMNGGTITCDAPSFTGTINGNFVYGLAGQTRTMNGLFSGTVDTVSGATAIFTDRTRTGSLNNLVASTVTVRGTFQGGGDGYVDVQNGTTLIMDGPNAAFNHKISVWGAGKLSLTNSASLPANNEVWIDFPTTAVAASDVLCDDTSTCTINGPWTCGNSSSVGDIRISSKGVLVIKQPVNNNVASRAIKINETSSAYTGVVRVDTGGSFPSSSLVSVSRGTLYLASTSTVAFSTGLTVSANATLACSSTNPTYAAQITGNVSLAANSTLRFGAPA